MDVWNADRRLPRGDYLIPCLLRDTETNVYVKGVLLDLSGTGCRVFTNDRRIRLMDADRLLGKIFRV